MPVPAAYSGSRRMEAREFVSKNQELEKADRETIA